MDELCTQHLLNLAGDGDSRALDVLFQRVRPRLGRLLQGAAPRSILERAEAEDLVQEGLAEGHRQLPRFRYEGPGSFFRWLAKVAMHRAKNLDRIARAAKRSTRSEARLGRDQGESPTLSLRELVAPGPGPSTVLAGAESASLLRASVAKLSAADRKVITLVRIEGRSLQEAAVRIGRTRNATALLLSRALRKLGREVRRSDAS